MEILTKMFIKKVYEDLQNEQVISLNIMFKKKLISLKKKTQVK